MKKAKVTTYYKTINANLEVSTRTITFHSYIYLPEYVKYSPYLNVNINSEQNRVMTGTWKLDGVTHVCYSNLTKMMNKGKTKAKIKINLKNVIHSLQSSIWNTERYT